MLFGEFVSSFISWVFPQQVENKLEANSVPEKGAFLIKLQGMASSHGS
jgi:hypothetical protein